MKKITAVILSLALGSLRLAYADYEIPKCIETDNRIVIKGQLDSPGEVTLRLTCKEDESVAYAAQSSTDSAGFYSIPINFEGSPENYEMTVNAGGNITDKTVTEELLYSSAKIDINAARCNTVAAVTAEIADYYGLYSGENITYTLLLVSYGADGQILSVITDGTKTAKCGGITNDRLSTVIPTEAESVKALIWKDTVTLKALAPAKQAENKELSSECFSNKTWRQVNMATAEMLENDIKGGEGAQRIMSIAVSADDSLILCGNDTGGINRSTDGGKNWEDCFGGFYPSGATSIAIDPKNKQRILASGTPQVSSPGDTNEMLQSITGLYLSVDGATTWKQVLSQPGAMTFFDFREAICYDKSSFDASLGYCTTAYWSRPWRLQGNYGGILLANDSVWHSEDDISGLWKTIDGGRSWFNVNTAVSDGNVKVNPSNGTVYVVNCDGFHRSLDGGITFETVISGMCMGLDTVDRAGYENYVWINNSSGVFRSKNSGASFEKISGTTYPGFIDASAENTLKITRNLKVSPQNPQNMVVGQFNGFEKQKRFYSSDGGATWHEATYDESRDFFKINSRHPVFAWSNLTGGRLWSTGGDWITSSSDGGKSYIWDYNGGGDVHIDQRTIFNIDNPDIMYYGSQDFHGALTKDGGKTWKHIWKNGESRYAGFVYGSYAADENMLVAIVGNNNATHRFIEVSRDAGETWNDTGCEVTGKGWCKWAEMCSQSPSDKNVLFAADYRSEDYGYTWERMNDVNAVCAYNPYGDKEIFGVYYNRIRISRDSGKTWSDYATVLSDQAVYNTQIWDIAYDAISGTMYYVSGNSSSGTRFAKYKDGIHTDLTQNLPGKHIQLCAVDPRASGIVYVGGYGGLFMNSDGVMCSLDSGESFTTLTLNGKEDSAVKSGNAGGLNPYDIIVHPKTGDIWVAQGCNGWAVFPAPY